MWSEDFDKKAMDAASNHSPDYDEKSWDRMESLLDKHLPVEKKKRRFIFWWILPALMGAIGFAYYISKNNTATEKSELSKKEVAQTPANNNSESPDKKISEINSNQNEIIPDRSVDLKADDNTSGPGNRVNSSYSAESVTPGNGSTVVPNITRKQQRRSGRLSSTKIPTQEIVVPGSVATQKERNDNPAEATTTTENKITAIDSYQETESSKNSPVDPPPVSKEENPVQESKKPVGSKSRGFFAGISLGPDISGLGLDEAGSWQMQYGLSVGYAFSKRFSVRTGFFASRKVYTAAPYEYHPPYNFWAYYPNLEKIDANCLVYEIPVSVIYNFANTKKHNWFASTGISSYLMKDETYDYYYKNSAGQPQVRSRTLSNENTHLFSVINISGGYRRNLNKHVFIMAEPYLKIPVSGIGFGNVKLNSGGLLVTVGIK